MLDFVADTFGNTVMRHDGKKSKKPYYLWRIKSVPAAQMLVKLLPYLIVKKRQAMIAIRMAYATTQQKREYAIEISKLNQGGDVIH